MSSGQPGSKSAGGRGEPAGLAGVAAVRITQPGADRGRTPAAGQVPGIGLADRGQQQRICLRAKPHRRRHPAGDLIIGQRPHRLRRGPAECLADLWQLSTRRNRSGDLDCLDAHNSKTMDRV